MDVWRSTETYTVEQFEDMGVIWNRVTSSQNMVVAILGDEDLHKMFEVIPPEINPL